MPTEGFIPLTSSSGRQVSKHLLGEFESRSGRFHPTDLRPQLLVRMVQPDRELLCGLTFVSQLLALMSG